jgi:hypothetical protein
LPLVHTFVARKTRGRNPISETRSPTTVSALPYIGELSIMRPPASVNRVRTSFNGVRAAVLFPTSKACQVPSPMTGIASPDDGIERVIIVSAAIAFVLKKSGAVAPPASVRTTSRRVTLRLGVIASAAKPSPKENAVSWRLLRRFAPRNDDVIWLRRR